MRALALRSALTDRAREGKIIVIDPPEFEEPETKRAVELLETWGALGKVLLVLGRDDDSHLNAAKSFRNLPEVLIANYPTVYEVLSSDTLVFTKPALDELTSSALASRGAASAASGPETTPREEDSA
jgi:large subunit ribosomal protein L4